MVETAAETERVLRSSSAATAGKPIVAWGFALLTVAAAAGGVILWGSVGFPPPPLLPVSGSVVLVALCVLISTYVGLGLLLAARRPENPIGWLFILFALAPATQMLTGAYALNSLHRPGGPLPGYEITAWASSSLFPISTVIGVLVFLLFPDGRLLSRRWLLAGAVSLAGASLVIAGIGLRPGSLEWYPLENPLGLASVPIALLDAVRILGAALLVIGAFAATASLLVRYRTGSPERRLQMKWVAYAVVLMAVAGPFLLLGLTLRVTQLLELSTIAACVTASLLPVAATIAILRHRLFDIDLIINRTLAWVALTAILSGIYAASIAFFQRFFVAVTGDRSDAALVLTALLLAGLFTPLRKTLEGAVDRRFRTAPESVPPSRPMVTAGAIPDEFEPAIERLVRRVVDERLAERDDPGRRPRSRPRPQPPGVGLPRG